MSNQDSTRLKTIVASVGAVAVAGAAAFFGFDLGSETTNDSLPDASVHTQPTDTSTGCAVSSLPGEADDVIDRILTNQDHIYTDHDGKHFGNYEGVLPQERGSYYREYTVDTPGLDHRGTRRIVVGGGTESDPDVWYYTDDHYESFCEIPDAED